MHSVLGILPYIFLLLTLGSLYGSFIIAGLIYVITTLHFMKCHRYVRVTSLHLSLFIMCKYAFIFL